MVDSTYTIKDSGQRTEFSTGAHRDCQSGKGRYDLIPCDPLRALAVHFELGSVKYGDRNWEKGIPISKFLNSGIRHGQQLLAGWRDENHAISWIWNAVCAYQTILWVQEGVLPPEIYDLPRKVVLPDPYGRYGMNASSEEIKKAIESIITQ